MKDIHLIQAGQARPLVMAIQEAGAPLGKLVDLTGLPLDPVMAGQGTLGEHALWRFVELGAREASTDLLGWEASFRNRITAAAELGGRALPIAPTLKQILDNFIDFCRRESSGSAHSMIHSGDSVWFHRPSLYHGENASWQVEQYFVGLLIQIVRLCASADWMPTRLQLCSSATPLAVPQSWDGIEIEWGVEATGVNLETRLLPLPPKNLTERNQREWSIPVHGLELHDLQFNDLVASQVEANRVGIDSAAFQLGLSTSTLRRRLCAAQTSYAEVLAQIRFGFAREALTDSSRSIHDIAVDLGYEYQANFTRAFKQQSGMTPSAFRFTYGDRSPIPLTD